MHWLSEAHSGYTLVRLEQHGEVLLRREPPHVQQVESVLRPVPLAHPLAPVLRREQVGVYAAGPDAHVVESTLDQHLPVGLTGTKRDLSLIVEPSEVLPAEVACPGETIVRQHTWDVGVERRDRRDIDRPGGPETCETQGVLGRQVDDVRLELARGPHHARGIRDTQREVGVLGKRQPRHAHDLHVGRQHHLSPGAPGVRHRDEHFVSPAR